MNQPEVRFVNLTRNLIEIVPQDEPIAKFRPSGVIARLLEEPDRTIKVGGIPLTYSIFALPDCLPTPRDGVIYVVPMAVALVGAASGRSDLAFPSGFVKDRTGKPIGARRLVVVSRILHK